MKNTVYFILLAFYLISVMMACSKSADENKDFDNFDDPDPVTKLTIENNKVICEACDGFGKILETYQNQVFVGGERQVWIFGYSPQATTLSQKINLTDFGFLNSITAKDGMLFLGVNSNRGTGSVRQYAKSGGEWQFVANHAIGRDQDDFGTDIAISDTLMVIGASARWSQTANLANQDEGRFYIYNKESTDWVQTQEFQSDAPSSDDRFGTDVIIADNFILVGGLSIPLHIYKLEGMEWTLARVENDIVPADMGNFGNRVLYYSEMLGLQSFDIDPDGTIGAIAINALLDMGNGIRFSEDSISMTESHALITTLGGKQVYLLQYENNTWTLKNTYSSDEGDRFEYSAIQLTENLVITSGSDYSNYKSYLYFDSYQ